MMYAASRIRTGDSSIFSRVLSQSELRRPASERRRRLKKGLCFTRPTRRPPGPMPVLLPWPGESLAFELCRIELPVEVGRSPFGQPVAAISEGHQPAASDQRCTPLLDVCFGVHDAPSIDEAFEGGGPVLAEVFENSFVRRREPRSGVAHRWSSRFPAVDDRHAAGDRLATRLRGSSTGGQ